MLDYDNVMLVVMPNLKLTLALLCTSHPVTLGTVKSIARAIKSRAFRSRTLMLADVFSSPAREITRPIVIAFNTALAIPSLDGAALRNYFFTRSNNNNGLEGMSLNWGRAWRFA